MKFDLMQDRKIELKKGINKWMIGTVTLVLIAVILILTSSMWLPDTKVVMARNNDNEITFDRLSLKLDEGIYKDETLGIGQISLVVDKSLDIGDNLSFRILTDTGVEFPKKGYKVIKSASIPFDADAETGKQLILLQFGLPEEFYYLRVIVTQKDYKSEEIELDYRNFTEKKLSEKEGDFYLKQQPLLTKLVIQENLLKKTRNENEGIRKSIEKLKNDNAALIAQKEVIESKSGKKEKQELIDLNMKSLKEYEVRQKKSDEALKKYQKGVKDLNAQLKAVE